MTKSWATFILWAIGLVVVLSWVWRKMNPAPVRPPIREPIVSVQIDDPGMEYAPAFKPEPAYSNWWTFDPRELTR